MASINRSLAHHSQALGIRKGGPIDVSLLGVGEFNENYLVGVDRKKFVFRVGLRDTAEEHLKREYDFLRELPPGFGPKALVYDQSGAHFDKPFVVLSYLEGDHVFSWKKEHLKAHAEKLAALHSHTSPHWGVAGKPYKVFDLQKQFIRDIKKITHGKMDDDMQQLYGKVVHYLSEKNHLITSLGEFSLVHGDCCVSNILFCKGNVYYIDWEWGTYRDPADDIARFQYEDISELPWNIQLSKGEMRYFYDCYYGVRGDSTLEERVKLWQVYWKFTDMVYFNEKLKDFTFKKGGLKKEHYEKTVETLKGSLRKQFL